MATISRIKPGQVLYTVTSQKAGNTTMKTIAVHTVVVREVDPEGSFVIASWNGNTARKFRSSEVSKWKVEKPVTITTGFTKRLATKAEREAIAAAAAKQG